MKENSALVLTGGGARGAYQAGVLKYIGENIPEAHFDILVGGSSGAINIAGLASNQGDIPHSAKLMADMWSQLSVKDVIRVDFYAMFSSLFRVLYDLTIGALLGRPKVGSILDSSPLKKLLSGIVRTGAIEQALGSGELKSVAVTATEISTHSSVTFVSSRHYTPWKRSRNRSLEVRLGVEHIMASSALPFLFPSQLVDNRRYVDGCIRVSAPLSPAARLGAQKIFAIGVRRYHSDKLKDVDVRPSRPQPKATAAQLGALVLNSLFFDSLDADVEHLERLNNLVADNPSNGEMRHIDVFVIRPSQDLGALASDLRPQLPFLLRYLLRSLGSEDSNSSDLLSYLAFIPSYTKKLVDIGYNDAKSRDAEIRKFIAR